MTNKDILHSWKEISAYLDRDVRTCLRWEKDHGLPVHRIDKHSSHSKVFAYKSEIDKWLRERSATNAKKENIRFLNSRTWLAFALTAAFISILYIFVFMPRNLSQYSPKKVSMAVFPFETNNPDNPSIDYLGEGLAREITNYLNRSNSINVIPVFSPEQFKNLGKDFCQIGEKLGVNYFLTGFIKKDGSNISLIIQLTRVEDASEIWQDEFEDGLENFYTIRNTISDRICDRLNLGKNLGKFDSLSEPLNPEIWDPYLIANYALNQTMNDEMVPWIINEQGKNISAHNTYDSNNIAIDFFLQTLKLDKNYAPAYIGLAQCYINYLNFSWKLDKKWLDQAEKLLSTAYSISSKQPDYYSTMTELLLLRSVLFHEKTEQKAMDIAVKGISLFPYYPPLNSILGTCHYLRFAESGRETDYQKAMEYRQRSHDLDPISLFNIGYIELLMLNRDFQSAINSCLNLVFLDASGLIRFRLGEIYYYMGNLSKAEEVFLSFQTPVGDKKYAMYFLGMIAAQKGDHQKTLNILQELSFLAPTETERFTDYLRLSSIYMGMGEEKTGYEYLTRFFDMEYAKKQRYIYKKYIALDKNFDSVRETQKFQHILNSGEGESWLKVNPSE